jgi:hypothetical protein
MSTTATVRGGARRTAHSGVLEALTRIGFVGYGLLHLAIAWLALQVAVHHSGTTADQTGAFQLLDKQPAGHALLIVIAVGLGAMALWQLLLAAVGHTAYTGRRRTLERIASLARVVVYAFLLWTDVRVLQGTATNGSSSQEHATAGILAHPAGQWLVALGGVVVFAIGVGMAIYGAKRSFESKLNLASARRPIRMTVVRLGQVGYIAKGVAFAVVGALLFDAAISDQAARSRGLDGAIRTLAGQPFGTALLVIIAIGFIAFGVYCFAQSRYRKI